VHIRLIGIPGEADFMDVVRGVERAASGRVLRNLLRKRCDSLLEALVRRSVFAVRNSFTLLMPPIWVRDSDRHDIHNGMVKCRLPVEPFR